ncbi:glycosyltransferase family 2 protein [Candidatus Saganbacteria bacterium]|nr:glycosyltransferase family 2 protein [Candidatus Saganbacteria bacterium]
MELASRDLLYSVVIPVYNSEKTIENVCRRIIDLFEGVQKRFEIILVNDGSRDGSWQAMQKLVFNSRKIKIINLMRNFGEHNAVIAGLNYSRGEYVIVMDDDGQNPPEEIGRLINKMHEGYDVVFAYYETMRQSLLRNLGSAFNDKIATILLRKPKGLYLCSFKIISRALVNEVVKYAGPFPYIDGLIFRSTHNIGTVLVDHKERAYGHSNYTIGKLVALWLNMFTNFSILPLRIATLVGLLFSIIGFVSALYYAVEKIVHPDSSIGFATLIIAILMFSGIQLLTVGVIGEYIGRLFMSLNRTPQFIVREMKGFHDIPTSDFGG